MRFTKMQGCGNDYIYVNEMEEQIPKEGKAPLVRRMSDRHYGIGGDGVIFIHSCPDADFEMEMYNADGSRGEMCGNGLRCVAKYVYEKGLTRKNRLVIKSCGRKLPVELQIQRGEAVGVQVNMGKPVFSPEAIPVKGCEGKNFVIDEPIEVLGKPYGVTCVSMGNPHAVIFVEDVERFGVERIGASLESNPRFPKRTNVEFVQVLDKRNIRMRVWERGSGETYACGTGACAAVASCVLKGLTDEAVTVKLLGGLLKIVWDRDKDLLFMEGPAETVFEGEYQEYNGGRKSPE